MKNFRKVLSLILALALALSCFAAFAADGDAADSEEDEESEVEIVTDFSDVDKTSVVGQAVTELALRKIITGYNDGTFRPESNVTRAEFAIICIRLSGLADSAGTDAVTHFEDLDNDDSYKWARPYVYLATQQGIINGFEDNTFRAADPVTYEQAVKMLMCLYGWQQVCESQTKNLQEADPEKTWSAGYIYYANQQGLLKNTNSNDQYLTQPITRSTVAILAYNSLSINRLETKPSLNPDSDPVIVVSKQGSGSSGSSSSSSNIETVSGVVTSTYVTAIDSDVTELGKYEIIINKDDTYEVETKVLDKIDLNKLIGQKVKMSYNKKEDIVTAISVTSADSKIIYSGVNGNNNFFLGVNDDGNIEYSSNPETFKTSKTSIKSYNVIFNGKYVSDFKTEDLVDPESPYYFTNGKIEIIDGKYDIVKINNYKTYVVKSVSSGITYDRINLLYKVGTETYMEFRNTAESGEYFNFRRGTKNIESVTDISPYDVISVMESPSASAGIDVTVMEVTRNSKTSQKVTGISENDSSIVELGGVYYQYNYDYVNYDAALGSDEKYDLARGDEGVSIYLDYVGQIAGVAVSSSGSTTSYKYGYLLSLTQDEDEFENEDADYKLEAYIMLNNGTKSHVGSASSITIDGVKYNSKDTNIADILQDTAIQANSAYASNDAGAGMQNLLYQQPVRYKLNSNGRLQAIDTVAESDVGDDLVCDVPYEGERTYSSSGGFNSSDESKKFSVSSTASKVFFIPDDRNAWDDYKMMATSSFTSGRSYNVEAYNLDTGAIKRAGLVLLYKTNDSEEFNYKSPFLIVSGIGVDDDDNDTVSGYNCGNGSVSTSATTTLSIDSSKLSKEAVEDWNKVSNGDIVRYLKDSNGMISELQLWLDASAPEQDEAVATLAEALSKRILAIKSTSNEPETGDAANAAFRLAYGTVLDIDKTDNILSVSPTLYKDAELGLEMTSSGAGFVAHKFSSSTSSPTKVFQYVGKRGAEYLGENGMDYLESYNDVGENASVVVTYSTGDTTSSSTYLKFVYIISK